MTLVLTNPQVIITRLCSYPQFNEAFYVLVFWPTTLLSWFIFPILIHLVSHRNNSLLSAKKKALINSLYATYPAPNGRWTQFASSWWTYCMEQLNIQIFRSGLALDQNRAKWKLLICQVGRNMTSNEWQVLWCFTFISKIMQEIQGPIHQNIGGRSRKTCHNGPKHFY